MCLDLDALRRTRYAVTLLILAMALFVSAETAFLGSVQATGPPQLILIPTNGETGTNVRFEGGSFSASDTTCSISSPSLSTLIKNGGCSTFINGSGFENVTGSFEVGNVQVGQYVVQVTGSPTGDFAQAVLNVTSVAQIILKPSFGETGTNVGIEGGFFSPSDTTCTLSSVSNGNFIKNPGCSVFTTASGFKNVTGSFVVGNVQVGQYVLRVTGSSTGDYAEAVFNVTSGPQIILMPSSGETGTSVGIEGGFFSPTDLTNICSISSRTSGNFITGGACSFFTTTSGFANVTGSFVVGNVPIGEYVVRVTGSGAGDFAEAVFNVTSVAQLILKPSFGETGTSVAIEGGFFASTDTTCSISSPSLSTLIRNGGCSTFITSSGLVNVTGSFVVGNVAVGQYVVRVTGSPKGDFAQAVFNVTSGPQIILTPASGEAGTSVAIEGGFFSPSDTTCTISSPGSSAVTGAGCALFTTSTSVKNVTGSFLAGNVAPGQYVIQVTGNTGDFAQAVFNVTSGPMIVLTPIAGEAGTHVAVNGTSFLPTDNTCTISSPGSSAVLSGTAACAAVSGSGVIFGSFTAGNVGPGQYVIRVTGTAGGRDFAEAVFNVTNGPMIVLTPIAGEAGTHVAVNGTSFLPTDNTCTISSPGSSAVLGGSAGCAVVSGTGVIFGSFIIGNVLPGQYVIRVTGTANGRDFAEAVFNVTNGPMISLSPGTAPPGHSVIVNGTSFLPTDTACVISSPGTSAVLGGSAGCAIVAGSGIVSGSFLVGNVLPGQYVIQVTGDKGDFAQRALNVTAGLRLSLSPGTGSIGTSIDVNGTGFLTTDQSCSISSTSSPNPILLGSAACAATVGTGIVHGSFVIGSVSPGEYLIEVTGCVGNTGCAPSVGDFAQAVLNVTQGAPTLTLSPGSAVEESTVTFIGSGLNPSDTSCTVQAYNGATSALDNTLITSPTCSIVSPGIAQGTFVVSPYATTDISWLVQVKGSPVQDVTPTEPFTVTPDVIVTPTSGSVNTVFTFTGSGFESDATSCTATVVPAASFSTPTCSLDGTTGQVSGSVIPLTSALAGTYGITVTDNGLLASTATGEFTVGTPSALLVLNPASVDQGEAVGVAGTGFNSQDAYCTISSPATNLFVSGSVTCLIGSGYASGSFQVSSTAPGGYYLITVQACSVAPTANVCPPGDALDFASNFLGVTLATTITTYSTTTTTSSSTTSMSTTTTSYATSFSYSSTTYSTTGIFFTTYTQYTQSTASGQTTTTFTQTTSSTMTETTVTVSTTTSFTTVPCGPLPCGFSLQPTINPAPGIDSAGLLAALLLLIPMLLRRLLS